MKELSFYDVKKKKKFKSKNYKIKTKKVNGISRNFAVATSPLSGITSWRVMKKD